MRRIFGPRRAAAILLAAVLPVILASCSGDYPNSTFTNFTEVNRDAVGLWDTMMFWAAIVFVLVEALLIYVMFRYRRRPGDAEPEQVHGNTAMELSWTIAPVVILVLIAIPTVRSIWQFQTPAPADAVQIDVIGHQWWWEFRYPQYNITTANEVYIPTGRAVNFSLQSRDVIHSFWIPQLAGKRDAITNRTNHLWFTPDSVGTQAFIGSCNEYCGASHANMRFRAFTVSAAEFDSWVAGQQQTALFPPPAPPAPATATPAAAAAQPEPAPAPTPGYVFPAAELPAHIVPRTPVPAGLTIDDAMLAAGDAQRGFEQYSRSTCIGCHRVRGNPMSQGVIGPDLTHFGSRHTLGAGLYPNDARHLALWLKNARRMKPMASTSMPTIGIGETDPILRTTVTAALGGLTDQQIADIVAYLLSLK